MADAADITETTVKLTAADGFTFEAFRATPKGAKKGGLIILQEIFGVTDQLKGVVRAYARDGYDTIIPALYDRVAPGTVVPFSEAERAELAKGSDGQDLVNSGLEETMIAAYHEIVETRERNPRIPDLRIAAFVGAIHKVARSYMELGIFP